jgi:hypothetical protein
VGAERRGGVCVDLREKEKENGSEEKEKKKEEKIKEEGE